MLRRDEAESFCTTAESFREQHTTQFGQKTRIRLGATARVPVPASFRGCCKLSSPRSCQLSQEQPCFLLSSPYLPIPGTNQFSSEYQPIPSTNPSGCEGDNSDVYDFNEDGRANAFNPVNTIHRYRTVTRNHIELATSPYLTDKWIRVLSDQYEES
ncbi:Hypp5202 [Branchiostoma lanceolatum]|uniref:Hypp5202 protein n=1 Tax=Branchiostoma lanceolatum TaxID=7740 RepID=A0A8K0AD86_BRALA|nr:Hypp5202 [Branchiostoma lanceolatum]